MAKNYIQMDILAVVCPKCGSEERTKYHNTRELSDVIIRGKSYGKIQIRRTSCKKCGQHRIERFFYEPENNSARRRSANRKEDNSGLDITACTQRKKSERKSNRSTRKSKAE